MGSSGTLSKIEVKLESVAGMESCSVVWRDGNSAVVWSTAEGGPEIKIPGIDNLVVVACKEQPDLFRGPSLGDKNRPVLLILRDGRMFDISQVTDCVALPGTIFIWTKELSNKGIENVEGMKNALAFRKGDAFSAIRFVTINTPTPPHRVKVLSVRRVLVRPPIQAADSMATTPGTPPEPEVRGQTQDLAMLDQAQTPTQ